jgi:hypothetical protein
MDGTITLSLGSISLTLGIPDRPFVEGTYPRERIEAQGVSFSAYGTPATDGTSYESPHLWNLVVLLEPQDAQTLARIDAKSRAQKLDITIVDRTDEYWELSPRTRATAPDDTEILDDGMVGYYAQFKGRFTAPIKQIAEGAYRRVSIQITETQKVFR